MPQAAELAQHERPQFADARIDTQGIGGALIFAADAGISGAHPYDHVGGKFGAFIGNCSYANGLWTTTDTTSGIQFPWTSFLPRATTQLTVVVWARIDAYASFGRLIERPYFSTGASGQPFDTWTFNANSTTTDLQVGYANAGNIQVFSGGAGWYFPGNPLWQRAITLDIGAGTGASYQQGVFSSSFTPQSGVVFDEGSAKMGVNLLFDAGSGGSTPGAGTQGAASRAFVFNRMLTARELLSFNLNPYQIWQSPRRYWQFGVSAGGNTANATGKTAVVAQTNAQATETVAVTGKTATVARTTAVATATNAATSATAVLAQTSAIALDKPADASSTAVVARTQAAAASVAAATGSTRIAAATQGQATETVAAKGATAVLAATSCVATIGVPPVNAAGSTSVRVQTACVASVSNGAASSATAVGRTSAAAVTTVAVVGSTRVTLITTAQPRVVVAVAGSTRVVAATAARTGGAIVLPATGVLSLTPAYTGALSLTPAYNGALTIALPTT